ncbi:flagellar hook-basal body complex protein FliE [Gryllotalpicola sp.]|uniref:flagellar hook-basal body complex protein FliE n=1 Tax=Gryllotalpicola sp. TaxID=1932787 RepID=UPI00260F40E8|nr:flagellar hook-basal body complex protein FliE [Gryllotalpicola sp.]
MSFVSPVSGSAAASALAAVQQATATAAAQPTSGTSFATSLTGSVDSLQALQSNANTLAVQAVTGNLNDIADATIAATRAQVTMELASAVRNKGVDAFNQIMNMQA